MKKIILLAFFISSCFIIKAVLTPIVDSIPMSDGRKLAADIYIPFGMTSGPVILIQTPYNRQLSRIAGLPMGIGMNIDSSKYIFVITDWRGFYGSTAAAYLGSPDNASDGYSNVEWIASQTWSNMKIGTWGPSALGKIQFLTAKKNPPHLVCINPSVAAPQFLYNEYYPNGALRTEYVEQLDGLGFGITPILMAHPYKDNTWNFISATNNYPDSIRVPCFMIGGWYDHNTELMMDYFKDIRLKSLFTVRSKHQILMGPWVHGGKGIARVGSSMQGEMTYPNAVNKNDSMSIQFFDYYLRNINNNWESNRTYTYYQMGINKWESSYEWPPAGLSPIKFYLHSDGQMLNALPLNLNDSLNFTYNPMDPSPTIGGSTLRFDLKQGPYDQRKGVENKSDILAFSSKVLNQDVTLKGKVKVHLKVSSDQLDTDFDVRITDVYPDSSSMLVGDGVMRMRFRNGFTQAETSMMQTGKIYDCIIEMPTTCITFLSGHQIRLIISSSNYPRFNRNMNNGGIMYPGNSTDSLENPLIANNTVHTNNINTSYIELPLLNYSNDISQISNIKNDINLFPIPADQILNLKSNNIYNTLEAWTYHVYNMLGQVVFISQSNGLLNQLDISELNSGMYILELDSKDQNTRLKFIKQ